MYFYYVLSTEHKCVLNYRKCWTTDKNRDRSRIELICENYIELDIKDTLARNLKNYHREDIQDTIAAKILRPLVQGGKVNKTISKNYYNVCVNTLKARVRRQYEKVSNI